MTLIVMTYNVANGLAPAERLLPLLRNSGAHVIGIQELALTQATAIAENLQNLYPHQILHPLGIPGKALLSRLPILDAELVELQSGRPDLRTLIQTPEGALTVLVAHPSPPRLGRTRAEHDLVRKGQLAGLIELIAPSGPSVVLGDFNILDRQRDYRLLTDAGLVDAYASGGHGRGGTLPTRLAKWADGRNPIGRLPLIPVFRVDYVWHTHHLRTLRAWRGGDAGSDHRPVLACLAFNQSSTRRSTDDVE